MTCHGLNATNIQMDRLVSISVLVQMSVVFKIPAVSWKRSESNLLL